MAMLYVGDKVRRGDLCDIEACCFHSIGSYQKGVARGDHDAGFKLCNHISPIV